MITSELLVSHLTSFKIKQLGRGASARGISLWESDQISKKRYAIKTKAF